MDDKAFKDLPNNQETYDKLIKIITTSKDFEEVFLALLKQAEVLYEYEEYEKVSKILIRLFNEQEHLDDKYLELLIDSLIEQKKSSLALYYINIRKETLSQVEMYKYLLDVLKYKSRFNEDYNYILDSLRSYSFDKRVLIPYYLVKFRENVESNSSLTLETYREINELNFDKDDKEIVDELYFQYLLKNKMSFENFMESKLGISNIYFQLRLLIRTEMLKRVQIIEAENEKELDELSLFKKEIIFRELRDFYDKNNDFRSYDLYKEKYNLVTDQIKKEKRRATKKKLVLKDEEEIVVEEVIPVKEKPKQHITSEKLSLLENFVKELSKLDLNLSLFERLRNIGILLGKYFEFSDILFYFRPQFYHFKKERLYNKNYSLATVESSLPGITSKTLDDIVSDVEFVVPDFDIITNKPLTETDVRQVYSYGVEKGASITFYQTERKDLHYDDLVFKTVSSIIYYDLKYDNYLKDKEEKYNRISDFFNSNFINGFIYKDELLGTPIFNELFKLRKNDNLSSLVLKFNPELRVKYNNLLNSLKKEEIKSFWIDLYYENKNYLAKHYINNGAIYGLFIEVTDKVRELKKWQEKSFVDPLLNVLTLHEFEQSFISIVRDKASFLLIELDSLDKIESLYGKAKKREFFLEFVEHCKNEFEQVYLFDQSTVIAVLKINDIRAVENKVSRFIYDLKDKRSKVLKEQRFNCHMGIIRYPINTREKNINRIYQYLSLSLYKAKTIDKIKGYSYFDFKDYEQDLFETEVIKQIDNLILTEDLLLNFTQIVNYKTKNVYAYEVGVTSNALHIYEQYYYQVAEKRDMLERLEKYVLEQTFKYLRKIYDDTGSYVRLVVNVSNKTLNTPNFVGFLTNLYRTYKIPYEVVEIKVKLTRFRLEEELKLKELRELNIVIGTDNLDYVNKDYIKVFHLTNKEDLFNPKTQNYLKSLRDYLESENMTFIVYNVDSSKEAEILEKLNINYIRGRVVDKEISYQELVNILNQ